ncbi:MAG: TIGR03905 family TSCPD domain-containing protein [Anaerovoracaceae bacterium]
MKHTYVPKGVCPTQLDFELDNGIVRNIQFQGGCNGNLKAIATLIDGMPAKDVEKKIGGISCGMKSTSCSDQLSIALKKAMEEEAK